MDEKEQKVMYAMLASQRYPWEQGVAAQAAYEQGEDSIWLPMAYDAVTRSLPDGRLAMLGSEASVADSAAAGEVCFRAWQKTGDTRFRAGAMGMLEYLMNKAPRTEKQIICHNTVSFHEGFSPYQLWVDAIYMFPAFLAVMGEVQEAYKQIKGYIDGLFDENNHLFYHIFDARQKKYVRKVHWATGNGWALMGVTRTAEEAFRQGEEQTANDLYAFAVQLLQTMAGYQMADGRFHDVLDDPDSFADGSSALMFASAVCRLILAGRLDTAWRERADRAIRAAEAQTDAYGILHEVCGCPEFMTSGTSVESQAAYLMARAWQRKLSAVKA